MHFIVDFITFSVRSVAAISQLPSDSLLADSVADGLQITPHDILFD